MSCFDIIDVTGNPFGIPFTQEESEYQTKDWECDLNVYDLTQDGSIVLFKNPSKLPASGSTFTGEVEITSSFGQFMLQVKEGVVTSVDFSGD